MQKKEKKEMTKKGRENCGRRTGKERFLALCLIAVLCLSGCGENAQEGGKDTEVGSEQAALTQSTEAESASAEMSQETESGMEDVWSTAQSMETKTQEGQIQEGQTQEEQTQAGENFWESIQAAEDAEAVTVEEYTYRPERETKIWYASNGKEACKVVLERPVFEETSPELTAVNAFYEEWAADKMESYEAIAKEACDWILSFGEEELVASYGDEVTIAGVTVLDQVMGIFHESYLYTGGAHGMPGRENHLFSRTDGKEVTLQSLTSLSEEELDNLVRSKFLALVEEDETGGFFEDAADTLSAKTDFAQFSYLTQEGVVFYITPYEIAPYAAGYTEVTIPYAELGM